MARRYEKHRIRIPAKVMAEDVKRPGAVTEIARDLPGRPAIDEIGSQRLIDALLGGAWFEKELAT
jgi:hypothetical protein